MDPTDFLPHLLPGLNQLSSVSLSRCSCLPSSHPCFIHVSLCTYVQLLSRPTLAGLWRDFRYSPLLPADVSPRRRILNVSRSVWKQANVASDLWEKLTARCVDRHRSDALLRSSSGTQAALRRFNWMGIRTLFGGCCIGCNCH